jgi:hypothetical protein
MPIDGVSMPYATFSADETTDIGRDNGSAVSDDYTPEESIFAGTVSWAQIDVAAAAEDADHMRSPEEHLQVAMAPQ